MNQEQPQHQRARSSVHHLRKAYPAYLETGRSRFQQSIRPFEARLEVGLAAAHVRFDNKNIPRLVLFCCRDGDGISVKTSEFLGYIRTPTFVEANSVFCKRVAGFAAAT